MRNNPPDPARPTPPASDASAAPRASLRRLNPAKLLLSKWTAVAPQHKEKHFIVTRLIADPDDEAVIVEVELEAVHSRRSRLLPWRELTNAEVWKQGWC
ncbi:TIGR02450 family Trp-rich protein [Rhodocyclus gracilis]|uniref:TIGR02450 family Trp-rich protein n=1 Tax=Rhodocyclus gracilis TaxID=2929842 RepID=UPI001E64DEB0|nr:TIGR02450 family Trp-rich protein [Rhodocyclus gracilis]